MSSTSSHKPEEQEQSGARTKPASAEPHDTVAMSEAGASLARVQEAAAAAPDTRADRVAELKARIAAGEYPIDTDELAQRLLDNP